MCVEAIASGISSLSSVFSFVSPIIGIMSSMAAAQAQAAAAQAQAQATQNMADYNAKVMEAQSEESVVKYSDEERKMRLKASIIKANQRAMAGASGIAVDFGSAADVQQATIYNLEQDAATIRYNALSEQLAYGQKATQYKYQGDYAKIGGDIKSDAAKLGGMTAMFSGLTDFATKWDSLAASSSKKLKTSTLGSTDMRLVNPLYAG